jgi:hypothetical protein
VVVVGAVAALDKLYKLKEITANLFTKFNRQIEPKAPPPPEDKLLADFLLPHEKSELEESKLATEECLRNIAICKARDRYNARQNPEIAASILTVQHRDTRVDYYPQ